MSDKNKTQTKTESKIIQRERESNNLTKDIVSNTIRAPHRYESEKK